MAEGVVGSRALGIDSLAVMRIGAAESFDSYVDLTMLRY